MEQQTQQKERIRALRKRLAEDDGLNQDFQNIASDWRNVNSDIKSAATKTLSEINVVKP